jgi:hypothetical protein
MSVNKQKDYFLRRRTAKGKASLQLEK